MNKILNRLFIFVFMLLVPAILSAEINLGLPTDNVEVMSAFYTDTVSLLTLITTTYQVESKLLKDNIEIVNNGIPFYVNGFFSLSMPDVPEGHRYSCSIGSYIRLNDSFSIPVYAYIAGGSMRKYSDEKYDFNKYEYNGLYTGSGLVWSSGYGSIGAFTGYYLYWGDPVLELNQQKDKGLNQFKFGLIPVLNTEKIPLLKYALSLIRNYLSFDFNESKLYLSSYEVKGYSKRIEISGNFSIESIYYGYSEKLLNPALKEQIHLGGIGFSINNFWAIDFEVGISNLNENIPDWYKYFEVETHRSMNNRWYGTIFAGIRYGSWITGILLEVNNYTLDNFVFGFILRSSLFDNFDPTNIGTGLLKIATEDRYDIAAAFRKFR